MIVKELKHEIVFDNEKILLLTSEELVEMASYFAAEQDDSSIYKKHGIIKDWLIEIYDAHKEMKDHPYYGCDTPLFKVINKQLTEGTSYG